MHNLEKENSTKKSDGQQNVSPFGKTITTGEKSQNGSVRGFGRKVEPERKMLEAVTDSAPKRPTDFLKTDEEKTKKKPERAFYRGAKGARYQIAVVNGASREDFRRIPSYLLGGSGQEQSLETLQFRREQPLGRKKDGGGRGVHFSTQGTSEVR